MIKTLRKAAKARGLDMEVTELTRHTAVRVGNVSRTLGRHNEVDEVTVGQFFDQFAEVLGGKGWWR
ncbi:ribonuclease PH [Actinomyces bovis]|uniref:ribonuclease PH n=1 Tax=Actinomyces bovis TaxID=1658 RepID=UPI000F846F95|nr:ribonuclease PH [Actinomyces bovis]